MTGQRPEGQDGARMNNSSKTLEGKAGDARKERQVKHAVLHTNFLSSFLHSLCNVSRGLLLWVHVHGSVFLVLALLLNLLPLLLAIILLPTPELVGLPSDHLQIEVIEQQASVQQAQLLDIVGSLSKRNIRQSG